MKIWLFLSEWNISQYLSISIYFCAYDLNQVDYIMYSEKVSNWFTFYQYTKKKKNPKQTLIPHSVLNIFVNFNILWT